MIVDPNLMALTGVVRISEFSKIQQSGIDVSLKSIKKIIGIGPEKPIYAEVSGDSGLFELEGHSAYDFECNEYIEVPNDMVALLIVRSTYNRKGAFITTGLYDNGFKNFIGGVIHTTIPFSIPINERIAQIVLIRSEHFAQYEGQYQAS